MRAGVQSTQLMMKGHPGTAVASSSRRNRMWM